MQLTPGMRRLRRRIGAPLVPKLAPALIRLMATTWTTDVLGAEHLEQAERAPGRMIALWHGRMLVGLVPHRDRDYSVLVSPSDDGDLSATLLARFGYRVVRGSTSGGGYRATRELLAELSKGGTVVITPDGPRGPRHSMNVGLAWLSRATGFPVVPGGFVCDRARHLDSWDRFTIPLPRARLAIVYEAPVSVDRRAGEAELDAAGELIRTRLLAAEERGFEHLGVERDW